MKSIALIFDVLTVAPMIALNEVEGIIESFLSMERM